MHTHLLRRMSLMAAALMCAVASSTPGVRAASGVVPLDTPTGNNSLAYALAAGRNGRTYLIWIEPAGEKTHALKFSRLEGQRWAAPREISRGNNWFVNWADHPSLTALPDGTLLAHWLVNTGRNQGSYGYGIRVARSTDEGATWSTIFEDGMENVSDYAGFLSFGFERDGARAVYLSPVAPDTGNSGHEHGAEPIKTLAAVHLDSSGMPIARQVIDGDVCSCCSTDVAATDEGLVAVYRDHLPGEIRDISIARLEPRGWTGSTRVHEDGWKIAGCPTNGPVVDARGQAVAVAWFTAANDTPRVKLAFSSDRGRSFLPPVTVDDGRPVGWPDVVMLDDGSVLVSWLERRGEGIGEILVRRVSRDGALGRPLVVAQSVSGRATGVPHMVRAGDHVVVAWRKDRVLTALVPVSAIQP